MGLSPKDQTKHNTLLRLGTQSIKIGTTALLCNVIWVPSAAGEPVVH